MKRFILLIVYISTIYNASFSQNNDKFSFKDKYFEAEAYLDANNFEKALDIYLELYKAQPENANINFKLGYCYINTVLNKSKAIQYLEFAAQNTSMDYNPESEKEKKAPIDALFWLGKAYHVNYKFQEAIETLNKFRPIIEKDNPELLKSVDLTIHNCQSGIELIKNPVKFNITNLGTTINSEYSEHSPVFSADESLLIFTSKREGTTGGKKFEDGQFYEDIYFATKDKETNTWSAPLPINSINTEENEATIGLSVDGQQLFIYRDENGDGNIFYSQLNGDVWSTPVKLPEPINTKSRETSASISADGKYLYFTSDRKGGSGGLDIYVSKLLPNGKWGDAMNLGPKVNTPFNEEGPYIHPDGVTLFFSSEGFNSMGGYDIFYTTIDNETKTCSEPTNLGYPINTTEHDVFYLPTPDGKRAYYASYQAGGVGNSDTYLITLQDIKEKALTVMSGIITLEDGSIPQDVSITVTDLKTKDVAGLYTPNSKSGKFLFILTPGTYNVLYESKDNLYYSENITVEENSSYKQINKAINLTPVVIGDIHEKYYAEFENNSSDIIPGISSELDRLADVLNKNKQLILDLVLPQEPKTSKINEARKKSTTNYLSKKGIDTYRIMCDLEKSKDQDNYVQLFITEKEAIVAVNQTDNTQKTNTTDNKTTPTGTGNDVTVANVFFDFDKHQTTEYYANLDKLVGYLADNPDAQIEIQGYTDAQGDEAYNQQLSIRRADFVKSYLISKGISKDNLKIKGFGEASQIAEDCCPQSRKYNRRVEFKILKQGSKTKLNIEPISVPKEYKL